METKKNITENILADVKITRQANEKKTAFSWKNLFSANGKMGVGVNWFKTTKYIYPITIIVIVIFLTWFMSFLYDNVYTTMSQAAELSNLKAGISEERLNKNDFDEILGRLIGKQELIVWINAIAISSTPFSYGNRPKINNPEETNASSTPNLAIPPIIITTTTPN